MNEKKKKIEIEKKRIIPFILIYLNKYTHCII